MLIPIRSPCFRFGPPRSVLQQRRCTNYRRATIVSNDNKTYQDIINKFPPFFQCRFASKSDTFSGHKVGKLAPLADAKLPVHIQQDVLDAPDGQIHPPCRLCVGRAARDLSRQLVLLRGQNRGEVFAGEPVMEGHPVLERIAPKRGDGSSVLLIAFIQTCLALRLSTLWVPNFLQCPHYWFLNFLCVHFVGSSLTLPLNSCAIAPKYCAIARTIARLPCTIARYPKGSVTIARKVAINSRGKAPTNTISMLSKGRKTRKSPHGLGFSAKEKADKVVSPCQSLGAMC